MPTPPLPLEELQEALDMWSSCGRRREEARLKFRPPYKPEGFSRAGFSNRLQRAHEAGLTPNVVEARTARKDAQQGRHPIGGKTYEVPDGLTLRGQSVLYNEDGTVSKIWNKTKPQGMSPDDAFQLPDPKKITKTATLYDAQGAITQQWVSEKPEDAQREALWEEAAKAMASELPKAEKIKGPKHADKDLLACYPVGDHHLGMLSWDEETVENWDLSIAEKSLMRATDYLVQAAPACEQALVVFLGDFMHYDSFEAVTPTSRNNLDADGRFPKMVRAAIRAMRYLIESAARHHKKVNVIVEIGNHDLSSSIFLMECLSNVYEQNSRISIDTSPRHCHFFEFGTSLIGTHHGHGIKMDRLPLLMATDMKEQWGKTRHRYWWTGHIHHQKSKSMVDQGQDYNGCSVESFRVLCPPDAWAAQKGYRPIRDQKCILIHREFGEVARHTVNPEMF